MVSVTCHVFGDPGLELLEVGGLLELVQRSDGAVTVGIRTREAQHDEVLRPRLVADVLEIH